MPPPGSPRDTSRARRAYGTRYTRTPRTPVEGDGPEGRARVALSTAGWGRLPGRFQAYRWRRRTAARGRSFTRDPSVDLLRVMLILVSRVCLLLSMDILELYQKKR